MYDAHFHISDELFKEFQLYSLKGICNISNIEEYHQIQSYLNQYFFHTSIGIHPWKADTISFEDMEPLLKQAQFIGEIGLDNTWCDVDMDVQMGVFEKQLQLAQDYHKPVILHIKGMEKEALEILKKYKNIYISHWYSCMDYIEEYDEVMDYFTIGPSVGVDEAVNEVVKKIDSHKLLIESDGIDAIEWAIGSRNYISTLNHSMEVIQKIKNEKIDFDLNFNNLLKRA
ncbi:TatD family hydrolase [Floccifex sp.]|uniref:TatD family hydrolase n=1 Tax=Floccifex sp. TaxID=2815810 RepID=UPI003F08781B